MSERLSINIDVPGINSSLNFIVPDDMVISKEIELIQKLISEEYSGVQSTRFSSHSLLNAKNGHALNVQCSLKQLGVTNGDRFLLL